MNRNLKLFLLTALCLWSAGSVWALEKVGEVYQIGTADQLIEFAGIVNGGENGANAVLTSDIDMTGKAWTPIGDNDHRYIGTFDGQYHTIDNLVYNNTDNSNIGIFGVVNGGCVIKNLIAGSNNNIKAKSNVGGIIGFSNGSGWVTLQNVGHEGYVEGTGNDVAAMIGLVYNGGPATKIYDCYNTGNIKGNGETAILTGWFGGHSSVEVKGFFNSGSIDWGQDGDNFLWRNSKDITKERIYNINSNQGATLISEGQLTSGALAYLLNGDNLAGVWHQTIGTDAHPVPNASHGIVRKMQDGSYVNRTLVDGYYEIAWGEDLKWFGDFVKAGNTTAKAKFVSDIDMTDYSSFYGVGQGDSDRFAGEIDGQRHKIKNWAVTDAAKKIGLVCCGKNSLVLKNITIDKTCSFSSSERVAGFITDINGDEGNITLSNLGNEGTMDGGGNTGGIVGCNFRGDIVITMTNCYNTGNITATSEGGGLGGWLGTKALTINCYNMGTVTSGESFARGNEIRKENCYDIPTNAESEFSDGSIFKSLFDYTYADPAVNGNVWRMEFSGTPHPVLYDAAVVLKEDFPNRPVARANTEVTLYRTTAANAWNTICLPFALNETQIETVFGTGAKVAVLTSDVDNILHFNTVSEMVAGKPYLVKPITAIAKGDYVTITGVSVTGTPQQDSGEFGGYIFKGVYEPTTLDTDCHVMAASNTIKIATNSTVLKGFRAYLEEVGTGGARATQFVVDDENVTGIITPDGRIIEDGKTYNLNGQRIQQPARGLYIMNGKKYVK